MNELSPLQSLDIVLKEIDRNSPQGIRDFSIVFNMVHAAYNILFEGQWSNIDLVLKKLIKDGFVIDSKGDFTEIDSVGRNHQLTYTMYTITFEGRLFLEQGGYQGEKTAKESDRDRIDKLQSSQLEQTMVLNKWTKWIFRATLVAAIYYLIEIAKFAYSAFQSSHR